MGKNYWKITLPLKGKITKKEIKKYKKDYKRGYKEAIKPTIKGTIIQITPVGYLGRSEAWRMGYKDGTESYWKAIKKRREKLRKMV